jgi:hypothetical protein
MLVFALVTQLCLAQSRFWIATTAGNWNDPSNWSATSGGAGGASVPATGNLAVFNGVGGRNGNCTLDVAPTVGGITVNGYTGNIDLNGNNITTTGAVNTLTTGALSNSGAAASLILNTAGIATFNGTLFNVPITGTSGRLVFSGSTFNGTVDVTKSNTNNDDGAGGNTFNAAFTLTKTGTGEVRFANTNPDIFNSTVVINQNATGNISLARVAPGTQFNANITINYNSTGGVLFGSNGGSSTLADTRTITVTTSAASGNLTLGQFTQMGATGQSITLTGSQTATLTIGPLSTFNGTLTVSTPVLVLNSSTFNAASFTQTSDTNTGNSRGGNLFQGVTSFTNTGNADLSLGTNAADAGDIFNGVSTFTSMGGGRIRVGQSNAGNIFNAAATFFSSGATDLNNRIQISRITGAETTFNDAATFINNGNSSDVHISLDPGTSTTFNGPVVFTSSSSTGGQFEVGREGDVAINGNVEFNSTSSDPIQLSAGAGAITFGTGLMSIGATGFSVGEIEFDNFTQTGTTTQSLTLTGTALIRIESGTTFNGDVTFTAPRLILGGGTFNGTATLEKTGATGDTGAGGNSFASTTVIRNSGSGALRTNGANTFNGTTTIANSGSADILFELTSGSTYNGNVTFTSTGSSSIRVGYEGTTAFNGNIVVNSTGGSTGIVFCEQATASVTLSATRTITIGATGFSAGDLRLQRFNQTGATNQALTLSSVARLILGPTAAFGGNVNFVSPQLYLQGTTFSGTAYLEKSGVTDNTSTGGNTFAGATTLVHSGSDNLVMANATADTFNSALTITNSGTGLVYMAHAAAGTIFNGNITVNSTGVSQGIYFSFGATGTSTLSAGNSINVGVSGFSAGELRLYRFTQLGTTAQNITLTANTVLRLGPTSTFNGNVSCTAPQIYLTETTFNGVTALHKTGGTDNTSAGGNVFGNTTTLANSGSGSFEFANTTPETFNGDLTIINTGLARIQIGLNAANNVFNGDVTINHGGNSPSINTIIARNAGSSAVFNGDLILTCTNLNTASGIIIGNDGNATINGNITVRSTAGRGVLFGASTGLVTLADGFAITTSAGNFRTGTLTLRGFTQLGNTAQNLNLTVSADLTLGPNSTFNGDVNFVAPQIYLNGTTFNGTTSLQKIGAVDNSGTGNNVFNGVTTISNSGSGIFLSGSTSQDIFNNDLTLINTGTASIRMADNSTGNLFNGNITVNSTAGNGIYFGNNANASASLADGRTITVGGSGFSAGELRLRRFTQIGNTAQTVTLTGTAIFRVGPTSAFNGDVNFTAPRVFVDGCTFNGTATLTKSGASNDDGAGGNIFNSTATIANNGTGYFLTGNTNADVFNGDLTVSNTNVASIRLADNSTGNQFNGNIIVSNTAGTGILIGNTSGNSTLANGRTISLGGGFAIGELRLRRITQLGSTLQALTLTGTAILRVGSSAVFNGDVTFISPQLYLDGATFNGTSYFEKNGATTNDCTGGNTFNGTTTIANSSTARLRLASGTAGDTFNGAVTLAQTSTGALDPAYNFTNLFLNNITTNSNSVITFAGGTGIVEFSGGAAQTLNKVGATASPILRRITMNKSAGDLTFNTSATVSISIVFTQGVINTTAANYLNVSSTGSAANANNSSYVDGPIRKTGNTAFDFPVGDNGFYRPISISAPTTATHFFTAQYFNVGQTFGAASTWDPTFWTVSGCEYWVLDRNTGASSNVNVTLSWNENACGGPGYITNPADLRVTRWTGTNWVNHGNGGTTGNNANGTIVTSAAVTAFSPFTLASVTALNPLPVELKKFWAEDNGPTVTLKWITASESNNKSFTIQRSSNGINYDDLYVQQGAGTSVEENFYEFVDEAPIAGLSYYRLKQTDFDEQISYPGILSLHRKGDGLKFIVYPNPAGNEVVRFNQKANITILNNLDQVVATAKEVDRIDVSDLPAGIYIIRNQNGQIARLVKK